MRNNIIMISNAVTARGIISDDVNDGISFSDSTNNPEGVHLCTLNRIEIKCIPNAVANVKNPAGIGFLVIVPHIIRQESINKT